MPRRSLRRQDMRSLFSYSERLNTYALERKEEDGVLKRKPEDEDDQCT